MRQLQAHRSSLNSIHTFLEYLSTELAPAVTSPRLEAEILLAHVLKQSRAYLYAYPEKQLAENEINQLETLLTKRLQHEPIAYLTGQKEFWSLAFLVTMDTLIPRPETEILVEQVLALTEYQTLPISVADLGTGCGTIALSLAHTRPSWDVCATDNSVFALEVAKQNAKRLGLTSVSFYQGNWCEALPPKRFTIIVSNPPYIAQDEWDEYANGLVYEPKAALISGKDGLEAIHAIVKHAKAYLEPKGYVFLEHGFDQGAKVRNIFTKEGYQDIITYNDFSKHARVTSGRYLP